jgi:hypothetical protein
MGIGIGGSGGGNNIIIERWFVTILCHSFIFFELARDLQFTEEYYTACM